MSEPRRRIGLYPGTFDPVTNGHLDVIVRASRLCDRLVVGVAGSAGKGPLFDHAERIEMITGEIAALGDAVEAEIEVRGFRSLLVDFAREVGARTLFRGLRAVADFDYEVQMFGMNSRLEPTIDTVFLVASEEYRFIASRLVKEIGRLGGDISAFVPPLTLDRTLARLRGDAG